MLTISSATYVEAASEVFARVATREASGVRKAADLIVASLRAGGVVQAFGTGHSEALAMEIARRAGGLVPTNRLALRDIVVYGDAPPQSLHGTNLERDPDVARQVYDVAPVEPADVFVIASNSGVNGAVVEMASIVKEKGHNLIAITSAQHSARAESRHPSGRRLREFADVVLDNGAPYGDALLPLPQGGFVCAVSSITAALVAQMIVAEVVRSLLEAGEVPPVYLSANIPEGDEHNRSLESRYAGRIRHSS